jgi:hypothetical protein
MGCVVLVLSPACKGLVTPSSWGCLCLYVGYEVVLVVLVDADWMPASEPVGTAAEGSWHVDRSLSVKPIAVRPMSTPNMLMLSLRQVTSRLTTWRGSTLDLTFEYRALIPRCVRHLSMLF